MYQLDPYQVRSAAPTSSRSNPLTIEDIERRRKALEKVGMGDSGVSRLNDMAGKSVEWRDKAKGEAKDWIAQQLGVSGLSSAAGASGAATAAGSTAATSALASSGAGAAAAAL